ncbi:MAG: CAP domain-containing protein [Firmicutes bacterium]|nr:CAP domain-containing protein [Bacillota bacterium]
MKKLFRLMPKAEQITTFLFVSLFLTCIMLAFSSTVLAVPGEDLSQMEDRTLKLINEARAEKGLKPLIKEKAAWSAARDHSADMANRDYFSHSSPEGKGVLDRIKNYGFSLVGRCLGENIAMNYNTADPVETAVKGWLKSPGHYKNIMDSKFIYTGIGIVKAENGKYYFTQVFWGNY